MNERVKLPDDPTKMAAVVMEALEKYSEKADTNDTLVREVKTNVAAVLQKHEDLNREVTKKYTDEVKRVDELTSKLEEAGKEIVLLKKTDEEYGKSKKRIEDLELAIATKVKSGSDPELSRQQPEYKDFWEIMKTRDAAVLGNFKGSWNVFRPDLDLKTMRTDNDTAGGYLVPLVTDNEIRKNITEMSPVRSFARVRVATSKTIEIPRRLTIPTAAYEGEGEFSPYDQSTYGNEQVTLFRQTVTIPATLDMMISSAFNLEQEIAMDVGEAFGKGEGTQFVSGLGVKTPQGFTTDSRVVVSQTAASGALDWTDMITVAGSLKRGQNPWYFMNRRTLAVLQAVKSTIGVPIWAPVAGDKPATIWGYPYNSDMIDLADVSSGSGSKVIVFGDLRRGYEIYDLVGISVVRDDLTRKREAVTEWTFRRYNTGRVVIPEAIKVLKIQ